MRQAWVEPPPRPDRRGHILDKDAAAYDRGARTSMTTTSLVLDRRPRPETAPPAGAGLPE